MFPSRTMLKWPLDTLQQSRHIGSHTEWVPWSWATGWGSGTEPEAEGITCLPSLGPFGKQHYRLGQRHQGGGEGPVGVAFACTSWTSRWSEDNKALEELRSHPSRQCAQLKHTVLPNKISLRICRLITEYAEMTLVTFAICDLKVWSFASFDRLTGREACSCLPGLPSCW